jgi:hypothetical protein
MQMDHPDSRVQTGIESASETANAAEKSSSSPLLLVANTHLLFNPNRGDIKLGQLKVIVDRYCRN